jgi:hypothetical protein
VIERAISFYVALEATTEAATMLGRRQAHDKLSTILEWLWDEAAGPVLAALGCEAQPSAGAAWPRLWWAPGGILGQLPVHAAGHHRDGSRRTVMDRVVSSYTPTARALRYAREHPSAGPADRSLIVAMPSTPGLPRSSQLPSAGTEAAMLARTLPQPVVLSEPAPADGDPAIHPEQLPTRANVLKHLPGCPIAHFACHCAFNPFDPSRSLLLLHDHESDPLTVASLATVNLGQAQLAYLSACRTAFTGAPDLGDEAIHLTSAFQLAGFPHVIGTLWETDDAFAVDVAEAFYAALRTRAGAFDTTHAARAIHHAIRSKRDSQPGMPSRWAAYVHAGI